MSRWVRVQADMFGNPIFGQKPFGKAEAFLWLSQVWDRTNLHAIHKTLRWPASRVWRFIRELITHDLIDADQFAEAERFYRKQATRTAIPTKVKAAVSIRDGDKCRYCGSMNGPFHFDHVFPWSKGGEHTVSNLVVACQTCNLKKKDKTIKELGWRL
ncbi:phage FluMu protein gp41 [Paenochrobactrum gallinarii]|uniref:Phage FluMu protein gp41 n=1 Tax=Paenochrobactrum gallinarii TaxID=643673 RepID=A0A841LZ78_9HYPH|nr:HNH endonuclease [Paenochrobactrum gallinarii]MBB6262140.1 phage FluMu protein gp41 [Paenochrobactrum gallinarii]